METSPFKRSATEYALAERKQKAARSRELTENYFAKQDALDHLIRTAPGNFRDTADWLIAMAIVAKSRGDIKWFPRQLSTMLGQLIATIDDLTFNTLLESPLASQVSPNDGAFQSIKDAHEQLVREYRALLEKSVNEAD
jgi:hypothetical protein